MIVWLKFIKSLFKSPYEKEDPQSSEESLKTDIKETDYLQNNIVNNIVEFYCKLVYNNDISAF